MPNSCGSVGEWAFCPMSNAELSAGNSPRQRVCEPRMTENLPHPSQRFIAPASIQQGMPLKELMDGKLVKLIGESLAVVVPDFDQKRFQIRAVRGLKNLELKDRALHIAH